MANDRIYIRLKGERTMIGNINECIRILPEQGVVTELLARIGEAAALNALMNDDILSGETDIPVVRVRTHSIGDDTDATYEIDDEPRRLVLVPGFSWMWYNAEGPEE